MNGTYQNGTRVRHLTLPDTGTSLRLGSTSGVGLLWHPRARTRIPRPTRLRLKDEERSARLRARLGLDEASAQWDAL